MGRPVLIVDEDDSFRELLRDVLAEQGAFALEARSGLEAVGHLWASERPWLVLFDLHLSRSEGWSLVEQLARSGRGPALELVGMTPLDVPPPRGVSRVLHKPFELAELLALLEPARPEPEPAELMRLAALSSARRWRPPRTAVASR